MDTLIIQSYCMGRVMETSGDIALQLKDKEKHVGYFFVDVDDPFSQMPFGIWPFHAKKSRKVRPFKKILKNFNIHIIEDVQQKTTNNTTFSLLERSNFTSLEEVEHFTYDSMPLGFGVLTELAGMTKDAYPDVVLYNDIIKKGLLASIQAYESCVKVLQKYNPKEIIIYNGRFAISQAARCAAKRCDVEVRSYEFSSNPTRFFLFEKTQFNMQSIKKTIAECWEEGAPDREAQAHHFFFRQRNNKEFNGYLLNQKNKDFPEKKKRTRVTFCASSDDEFVYLYDSDIGQSSIFASQREAVKYLIEWVSELEDVELVIRAHPFISKKSIRDQLFWNTLSGKNTTLITSDSSVDTYALIESSDLILTYGSMTGIEATYWGRPSVSLCCSPYSGWECVYEPKSLDELSSLLMSIPKALLQERCLPFGYTINQSGNYRHQYYSPKDAKFCDVKLSVDLRILQILKESILGKYAKKLRAFSYR
ncbi:MAG: hypothetical protein A3E82_04650 [Gammaproteobacteria bacterium RIFCSPHIGHO2_12_FULL_38_11]|nr:MAG: hypothetical protein A3E82_04650 [Gammaproteobacteria bacterium RIFCSPHIGHO2_12_FULL_38_11]